MTTWRIERPYKRLNPSGKLVYRARVYDKRTQKRSTIGTFPTRGKAVDASQQWIDKHNASIGGDTTLERYFEIWTRRHPRPSARTNDSNHYRLRRYVLPRLGDVKVAELRRRDIVQLRNELMDDRLAAKMIRNVLGSFSSMLSDAVQDEAAEFNPAFGVKVALNDPRITGEAPRKHRILSYDLMLELADKAPDPYKSAVLFPGISGARPAEIWPRLHADVHVTEMRVRIDTTAYNGRTESGTKTDHGRESPGRWSIVTDEFLAWLPPRDIRNPLLWPSPRGGVWWPQNFHRKVFKHARKAAGLDDVTLYDLRHSFVSLMQEANIPVADLAAVTGHERVSTLQDVYTHALGRSQDEMRAALRRKRARKGEIGG